MTDHPKTTDRVATTKLACRIADTRPDRFNEAVHAGFYPCAPRTTPGVARSFNVDDIVALRLYQRGMDAGMSAAAAGAKACKIREFMAAHPGARRVYIVATDFKVLDYLLPEFDLAQEFIKINSTQSVDVIGCEVIDLDWHRVRVTHALNTEPVRVGEAD